MNFYTLQNECEAAEEFIIKNSYSFLGYFLPDDTEVLSITCVSFDSDVAEVGIEKTGYEHITIYVSYEELTEWKIAL